jgi:glucosylceramidase
MPGDFALDSFNIDRDRQALLPFIQAALKVAGRPIQLLVSPWSPPAWMKTTGAMNGGGRLRPECRASWAQCFVRFIQAYQAEGVPVWGVSVQNEPLAAQRWDSCLYSAEEERDFVRDHLGPALAGAGLGHVKIVIWDHNRDELAARASVVYADAEAARYVWGAGFHWYVEDHFDQVQLTHDAWPDKQLLFTEGCQEGGPHIGSWDLGERYARSMINDLNRWTGTCCSTTAAAPTMSATCAAHRSWPTPGPTGCCTRARTTTSGTSAASSNRARSACCARPISRCWRPPPSSTPTTRWPRW